jgi:hypothetical protein
MQRTVYAVIVALAALVAGCTPEAPPSNFALGAFPPTMPDDADHREPWSRTDCLSCHAQGANEAPKMEHTSVPPLAEEAKCRTCHVLVPKGSSEE